MMNTHPIRRSLFRAEKLLRVAANRRWWPTLRRGVAPTVELDELALLKDYATVIDVGANRGQFVSFASIRFPSAEIIAFEPLGAPRMRLANLGIDPERLTVHGTAVGNSEGSVTLHVSRADDSSSVLPIGPDQVRVFPGTEQSGVVTVPATTLDKALRPEDVRHPALLKVDVQGAEQAVIDGAGEILPFVHDVLVECSFIELYQGQARVTSIIRDLDAHGFDLVDVTSMWRDSRGEPVQADWLFRRRSAIAINPRPAGR